jgi:hypothetical protein
LYDGNRERETKNEKEKENDFFRTTNRNSTSGRHACGDVCTPVTQLTHST